MAPLAGILLGCALIPLLAGSADGQAPGASIHGGGAPQEAWSDFLPPSVLIIVAILMAMSAFFSSTETAFLSIPRQRLRAMREDPSLTARLVVGMLDNPGRLITTILVGNMLVNSLTGVVLGARVKDMFEVVFRLPAPAAYAIAIAVTTSVLLLFGEITPKVIAVRVREPWARIAVFPLLLVGRIIAPLRDGLLAITDFLFKVTRFHELRAAPFITDEELKSILANGRGDALEEDGRQMIRNILEFQDSQLREILVPRPDIIAIPEEATLDDAIELYRKHEYSRMPVFKEDLDHITGILYAKDALSSVSAGRLDRPVSELARAPHFVPETMSIQSFIKDVQRSRSHLAVVVDEFGGTEGIVTLQDAIEEVVGDIRVEDEEDEFLYESLGNNSYRVMGGMSLGEFEELVAVDIEDTEHQTVAGFLIDQIDKIPMPGDRFELPDLVFTVESVQGLRVQSVIVEIRDHDQEDIL